MVTKLNKRATMRSLNVKASGHVYEEIVFLAGKYNLPMATVIRCMMKIALRQREVLERMLKEEAY